MEAEARDKDALIFLKEIEPPYVVDGRKMAWFSSVRQIVLTCGAEKEQTVITMGGIYFMEKHVSSELFGPSSPIFF